MPRPQVAVVGGGFAGMAAAVTLADAGVPVTVFEAGATLGGRARRVHAQGVALDNGQHILSGAYAELLRLMRCVGVPADAVLRLPLELRFTDGFAFRALWWPAPLDMLGGLFAARGIAFGERYRAARFLLWLRKRHFSIEPDCSVEELLAQHGQQGGAARHLWVPLCIAALNTPPQLASARVFARVLRETFAADREASDLLLPRVDLSRLFPEQAADFVRAHGGDVRTAHRVREISGQLELDGEAYSQVILAVAPQQLAPFAALLRETPAFTYQPIYTCYLQYPGSVRLPFPMLGFASGLVQWAFDRGTLLGEKGRIACVISAQGDHQQMAHEAIALACHRELAQAIATLPEPQWSQVIAEKRATITCAPGLSRPGPRTATPGLFLAGDFTDPDFPATLEAAARSGVRAAKLVLEAVAA